MILLVTWCPLITSRTVWGTHSDLGITFVLTKKDGVQMFSVGTVMQILYKRLELKLGGPYVSWKTEDNAVSSEIVL